MSVFESRLWIGWQVCEVLCHREVVKNDKYYMEVA